MVFAIFLFIFNDAGDYDFRDEQPSIDHSLWRNFYWVYSSIRGAVLPPSLLITVECLDYVAARKSYVGEYVDADSRLSNFVSAICGQCDW